MKNTQTAKTLLTGELTQFIGSEQRAVLMECLNGEEASGFADTIISLAATIKAMPVTYQTDGQGKKAMIQLHYFLGGIDAWVTEKDKLAGPQHQAFGAVRMGGDPELGYISIKELIENNVEIDLYWSPVTLGDLK